MRDMAERVSGIMPKRFPLESAWASTGEQEIWRAQLESAGLENVRIRLILHIVSSDGTIAIGGQTGINKSFIEEWVTWHEQQKIKSDEYYRSMLVLWTKFAVFAAVAATFAAVLQAIFVYLSLIQGVSPISR